THQPVVRPLPRDVGVAEVGAVGDGLPGELSLVGVDLRPQGYLHPRQRAIAEPAERGDGALHQLLLVHVTPRVVVVFPSLLRSGGADRKGRTSLRRLPEARRRVAVAAAYDRRREVVDGWRIEFSRTLQTSGSR